MKKDLYSLVGKVLGLAGKKSRKEALRADVEQAINQHNEKFNLKKKQIQKDKKRGSRLSRG